MSTKQAQKSLEFGIFFDAFWLSFAWLSLILALGGIFFQKILASYAILSALAILYRVGYKQVLAAARRSFSSPLPVFLAAAIIFSFFVTPTIFSGRDQGSFSEAAIRLAQGQQLEFQTPTSEQFFKIYGNGSAGKALNFPGFYYNNQGQLITQFPLPYIAWLGSFYSFFKINGLIIANAALLLIFLCNFYRLGQEFIKQKKWLFWMMLATLTSFTLIWINKHTLSENLAQALVWTSILWLVRFRNQPSSTYFWLYAASAGLLTLARIEGFLLLAVGLIIIIRNRQLRGFLWKSKMATIVPAGISFAIIGFWDAYKNLYFFKEVIKGVLPKASASADLAAYFLSLGSNFRIFFDYGLFAFFILGGIGVWHLFRHKSFTLLTPLIVVAPTLIYLVYSFISSDHPWMLRRFSFSILPAAMLYAAIWFDQSAWPKFRLKTGLAALVIMASLPAFVTFLPFSENQGLASGIPKLAEGFRYDDLVLVDRLATGDPWSMLSGPLNFFENRNAVYFFNPDDYDRLEIDKFHRVYLVTNREGVKMFRRGYLGKQLKRLSRTELEFTSLGQYADRPLWRFPRLEKTKHEIEIWEIVKLGKACSI